jgi:hypothetical protein
VETNIPKITTTAMGIWVSHPAPVARACGIAAAIQAKLVMRMGRNRIGAASKR